MIFCVNLGIKIASSSGLSWESGLVKLNNHTFKIGAYKVIYKYIEPLRDKLKFVLMAGMLCFLTGSLVACNAVETETLLFPTVKGWDLKS